MDTGFLTDEARHLAARTEEPGLAGIIYALLALETTLTEVGAEIRRLRDAH